MPNERLLACEYGVARNRVRKVLTQMVEDGLVERQVGRGIVVLDRPDILNLRIFIEPHSAEAAARNASSSELEAIIEANAKCAEAIDLDRHVYWDSQFHEWIHQAAHNAFPADMFDLLSIIRSQPPMMELRRRTFTEERCLANGREHEEILSALKNWDGKAAARAMRDPGRSRRCVEWDRR